MNPQNLVALRKRKGLTRQALADKANVSVRQLARIEKAPSRVRQTTLDRLARALDVDVKVLTGEQPLPAADEGAGSFEIDPESLKALRSAKGWSRSQLADRSRVSKRQLARLESAHSPVSVRMTTFKRIVEALGTDGEKLTGASVVAQNPEKLEDIGLRVRVSPQLQLAYDLVSYRYGPTRREIVELAPLLFVLLAEGSLAWRRERAEKVDELIGRLHELGKHSPLYGASFLEHVQDGNELERRSISNVDLMGNDVRREEWGDSYEGVPFCDYLCKLAEDIGIAGIVDFFPDTSDATVGYDTIWGAEPYEVCRDILGELTGTSKLARRALLHGNVRLPQIPKDLLSPEARDARVAWLEGRLSDLGRSEEEFAPFLSSTHAESEPEPNLGTGDSGEGR